MPLKIENISVNVVGQAWDRNLPLFYQAIDEALEKGADIIAFPELALTGPDCGDYFHYTDNEKMRELLQYIADYTASKNPNVVVSIGHPWRYTDKAINRENNPFIAQSLIQGGKILGMTFKSFLEDKNYESRHFAAWHKQQVHRDMKLPGMKYRGNSRDIKIPDREIPVGNVVFELTINDEKVTLGQIIGDKAFDYIDFFPQTTIVLNPTATLPESTEKQTARHDKKIALAKSYSTCHYFVSTNDIGNSGGRYAFPGDRIALIQLPDSEEKVFKNSVTSFHDINSDYIPDNLSPIEQELRNDALWLFDYLRKFRFRPIIQAFSGGFLSVYNAAKVRHMVELAIADLGVEGFLKALHYSPQEIENIHKNADPISAIMKGLLVCVYTTDASTPEGERERVAALVESVGGTFKSYDIQAELEASIRLHGNVALSESVIENLKDRMRASLALEEGNFNPRGVGISNTNLDKLCLNQTTLGGNLHSGQLGISQQKWRSEQLEHLKYFAEKNPALDLAVVIEQEETLQDTQAVQGALTAKQTQFIFSHFLYKKQSPIQVFEQCRQSELFRSLSINDIYQTIKYCYQQWGDAQLYIHASPLSSNYDGKGVRHDDALRTPNISGFHREELAELALRCISSDLWQRYKSYLYSDSAITQTILDAASLEECKILVDDGLFPEDVRRVRAASNQHTHGMSIDPQSADSERVNLKIALASCNQTSNAWADNVQRIREAIDQAVDDGADVLCLQELVLSGYSCNDYFEYTDNDQIHMLLNHIAHYAAQKNPNLMMSIGHPWRLGEYDKPFNVQSFISGGKIVAMSAKSALFNYERGYEERYFEEWKDGTISVTISSQEKPIPFGLPVVNMGGVNLFHLICEEIWVGSRFDSSNPENYADNLLARMSEQHDIGLCINPNTSPPADRKMPKYEQLMQLAMGYCQAVAHVNTLGTESGDMACWGTQLIGHQGKIVSRGPCLSTKNVTYSSQVIDIKRAETKQGQAPHATVEHVFQTNPMPGQHNQLPSWLQSLIDADVEPDRIEYEIELRTELLWLFDVMRKKGIQGFVQALSGGMDSAYNIVKLRLMAAMVIQECGVEAFLDALHYPEDKKALVINEEGIEAQLDKFMSFSARSFYLSTPNNSEDTLNAAKTLIEGGVDKDGKAFKGIAGSFVDINIQPVMDEFLFMQTGIDSRAISPEQKALIIEKLRLFSNLRRDEIQAIYNSDTGNPVINAIMKGKVEASTWPDNRVSKIEEERKLLNAIKAQFYLQIQAIIGQDIEIPGVILTHLDPAHGLPLENKYARIRKEAILSAMERASEETGFVFSAPSNPNKSEGSNSYTTYCGDQHSGEYSLNAHKHKARQVKHMQYLEIYGLEGVAKPVKALHWINHNKPSAELQPQSQKEGVKLVQFDEDSMGRSYEEMEILTNEMFMNTSSKSPEQRQSPIEVFEKCKEYDVFKALSLEARCDKILTAYSGQYWVSAQHKIESTPLAMTYGGDIDHKLSLQTPLLNAFHAPELAQLMLHSIKQMAVEKGTTFEEMTGRSYAYCHQRVLTDTALIAGLNTHLWTDSEPNRLGTGRTMKIAALYEAIEEGKLRPLFYSLGGEHQRVESAYDYARKREASDIIGKSWRQSPQAEIWRRNLPVDRPAVIASVTMGK
ncbi:MAG: hypothetical protein KBD83_01245 [Gammaproteobacteria bacterium]|nr:hypothetical protein [Gammaproteobacteria bacterium]